MDLNRNILYNYFYCANAHWYRGDQKEVPQKTKLKVLLKDSRKYNKN